MKSKIKIIAINIGVLLFLLLIVELFFGSWIFKKNNLNHLNIIHDSVFKFQVESLYDNQNKEITYSRDKYGLRGKSTYNHPEKIDILTIGGSTTDQRYIDDALTWQEILELNLKSKGVSLNVSNAGIDGQSTYGHLKNFELWFPLIPDLKPKYILFYVGFNDFYKEEDKSSFDKMNLFNSSSVADNIKYKSAIYNLARKVRGIIKAKKVKIGHEKIDFSKYNYVSKRLLNETECEDYIQNKLSQYRERLEALIKYTHDYGAIPIFVTQPGLKYKFTQTGEITGIDEKEPYGKYEINGLDFYYILTKMNRVLYELGEEFDISVVELTDLVIWNENDFYDFSHMTPQGAKKVGNEMAERLNFKQK